MDPLMVWMVLAALALVGIIYAIVICNNPVRLEHHVFKAWSNIDVLRQRHDEHPKSAVAPCSTSGKPWSG